VKVAVEEVVEVEVDVDMAVDVVVVVDLIVTLPTTRTHSAPVEFLLLKVALRKESLVRLVKGVAMVVDLVVLTAVVAVVVSVMEKLVMGMGNALEGHMSAVVGLGAGEYYTS
jgi:hypothetical protein